MATLPALVHPLRGPTLASLEKRASARQVCDLGVMSRPLDSPDAICWGGTVHDISNGGLGLRLCYPFGPGVHLALELQTSTGLTKTLLVKVIHVEDKADGTWQLGCEFVRRLSDSDVEILV